MKIYKHRKLGTWDNVLVGRERGVVTRPEVDGVATVCFAPADAKGRGGDFRQVRSDACYLYPCTNREIAAGRPVTTVVVK